MRVLLVDVDSKLPNLALMKLSAYHKARGDQVSFTESEPNRVYASVVFKANRHMVDGLQFLYPDADIRVGGSGYDLTSKLDPEIEYLKPDYSLYPEMDYSMGFTTRGCIRKCHFCIVPQKEGGLERWQHPKDWHNDAFRQLMLMDNNWFADRDWFFETSEWIRDSHLGVREHGMDIRLLDEGIAKRLKELRWASPLHFAYDHERDRQAVTEGIALLKRCGIPCRSQVRVYVYLHDSTEKAIESAKARCRYLKELDVTPLVMFNIDKRPSKEVQRLRRWANRAWVFWSCDIDEYGGSA